jgi:hypothetical protein
MRFVEKPRFQRLTRERKLFYMLLVDEERGLSLKRKKRKEKKREMKEKS